MPAPLDGLAEVEALPFGAAARQAGARLGARPLGSAPPLHREVPLDGLAPGGRIARASRRARVRGRA